MRQSFLLLAGFFCLGPAYGAKNEGAPVKPLPTAVFILSDMSVEHLQRDVPEMFCVSSLEHSRGLPLRPLKTAVWELTSNYGRVAAVRRNDSLVLFPTAQPAAKAVFAPLSSGAPARISALPADVAAELHHHVASADYDSAHALLSKFFEGAGKADQKPVSAAPDPQKLAEILRLKNLAQQKISFLRILDQFLGLNLDQASAKDWRFKYGYGKSPLGGNLNLEVEILVHKLLALTPQLLDEAARQAVDERGTSLNPLKDSGRLGIAITNTRFHHSAVMGDHNHQYVSFYLRMSDATYFESVVVKPKLLSATIASPGPKGLHHQRLTINKSRQPFSVKIEEWDDAMSFRPSKTIYLDEMNWHDHAQVTKRTSGL